MTKIRRAIVQSACAMFALCPVRATAQQEVNVRVESLVIDAASRRVLLGVSVRVTL